MIDKINVGNKEQFVYWDNGKKITVISDGGVCNEFDSIETIIDVNATGMSLCNLRDGYYIGDGRDMRSFRNILDFCLAYAITDISYELDDCNTLEEKIKFLKENEFSEVECIKIIKSMKFNNLVVLPVYAIVHSGVHLFLNRVNDWDSGFAGFIWSDAYSEPELEKTFETYCDFIEGNFHDYHFKEYVYDTFDNKWIMMDDYWDTFRSFNECWEHLDFTITNVVDKPDETFLNEIRNKEIADADILSYLRELGD